ARRLDEQHLPTLMHLAEAYERNAEWRKSVDVLEKALAMLPQAWNPTPLRLRVARLYAAHDPPKALENLQGVLDRDPKHPEALELFLQLCSKSGDTEGARRAAHALLEAADGVPGRVAALTKIGELESEAGNADSAAEALHMAVVLEGPGGGAANAYRKVLGRRDAQGRYVEALTQHIERVRRGELVDAELVKSYLEVARIMREQLGDHTRALVALKRAVAQLPDDPSLGLELSEQLARMGRQAEATAELERQLLQDPSRAGAWRLLARLLQELGRPMDAALAVAPVMLFDKPSSVEKNLYQRGRDAPRDIRAGCLSREWLDKVAKSSGEDSTVTELAQLLGEALLKLRPFDPSRWGLSSRDRLGPRDDHPLRAVLDETLRVFGLDRYELYLHQKRDPGVQAQGDRTPILVAPAALGSRPVAQQRFLLARALVPFARGLAPAFVFGTDELDKTMAAAIRGQDSNYLDKRFDENELASLEKQLGRGLSRRNKKALANPANELVSRRFDVAAWREIVEQSATFAAALYVGDLVACYEALRTEGSEPPNSPRALVSFWGAARSFDLRHLAGLSPRG
ncbi:MAG TPA: tetratricopeptide repeat protein, partial [Polyangiaceae bacterium]|nr:tetratricopeptide repeat protein [Polyangiaceae bacterium]